MRSLVSTIAAVGTVPEGGSLFGYEVIDTLGQGAGSQIYVVSDPTTKQLYALKHVQRKEEKDIRFIDQLEAEFNVGNQVSHAGLRRCFDFKVEKTILRKVTEAVLVMELFDGAPLEQSLPSNVPAIIEVFSQTAGALAALHDMGFVHCDLKPNNILLGPSGDVKVIDLGQACAIGTVKERIQGTPDYISPEQVKRDAVTVRTDIYNLGATMYWALTGKTMPTLFTLKKGENSFLVDDQLQSPRQVKPSVPENLSNLVMECVKTNPAKRPADMATVQRRLDVIHHSVTRVSSGNTVAAVEYHPDLDDD